MIKVISFDFDGTITKTTFADLFWLEGLPKLYARKEGIPLEEAKDILFREYERIGKERLEWYDPEYWFERFKIDYDWKKLMLDYSYAISAYPDALSAMRKLRDRYDLVVISNARREFIDLQIERLGLENYFSRVFSTVSDFRMVKKEKEVYLKVCREIGVSEEELIHVGDDYRFDFLVPRSIGIKAYYLDRKSDRNDDYVINSLEHLPRLLKTSIDKEHK